MTSTTTTSTTTSTSTNEIILIILICCGAPCIPGSEPKPVGSGTHLLLPATCLPQLLRVLEARLHELASQPVHVALSPGQQALQEAQVAPVGRHQQGDVGQVLHRRHGEAYERRGDGSRGQRSV